MTVCYQFPALCVVCGALFPLTFFTFSALLFAQYSSTYLPMYCVFPFASPFCFALLLLCPTSALPPRCFIYSQLHNSRGSVTYHMYGILYVHMRTAALRFCYNCYIVGFCIVAIYSRYFVLPIVYLAVPEQNHRKSRAHFQQRCLRSAAPHHHHHLTPYCM